MILEILTMLVSWFPPKPRKVITHCRPGIASIMPRHYLLA